MTVLDGFVNSPLIKMEAAPVTGSTTVVPSPYNMLVLTNGATTAAQTITLPASPVDGQFFHFCNPAAQVTALTYSPTVKGWTNAAQLNASAGHILCWSVNLSTAGQWFVVK